MKRLALGLVFVTALVSLTLAPMQANAAFFSGTIVPEQCHCDNQSIQGEAGTVNSAPDFGCVLATIQNVINFMVTFAMVLTTIYLVITGFSFILSAGSSEARSKAKTRFANVFIGLTVMLAAWLIIDFVMKQLYSGNEGFGPWNSILAGNGHDMCIVVKKPESISGGPLQNVSPSSGTTGGNTGGPTGAGGGKSKLNISSAVSTAKSKYSTTVAGGQCWVGVRKSLCGGGLSQFCNPGGYNAFAAGPYLVNAGFTNVYSGTYSYPGSEQSFSYEPGDVIIFAPVPGHPYGHSTMYVGGNVWISDFTQNGFMAGSRTGYKGGSFKVYRP